MRSTRSGVNPMADQKDALDRLFKTCWNDEALKQRFISDPPEVLKEFGVRIPEDRKITVVENTDDRHHITLPRLPSAMLMMFRAETMFPEDDQQKSLARLYSDCCKDETLKQRFIDDPVSVMKDYRISIPVGCDIKVIENTDERFHITLPRKPSDELSDDDLRNACGGLYYTTIAKTGARSL